MVCLDIYSYILFLVCFTWSFCLCLNLLFEYVVYVYPQILEILNYFLKYLFDSKSHHLLFFISFPFGNLLKIESDPNIPGLTYCSVCLLPLCCSVKLCWWWQSSHCLFFYFLGWNNFWFRLDEEFMVQTLGVRLYWWYIQPEEYLRSP